LHGLEIRVGDMSGGFDSAQPPLAVWFGFIASGGFEPALGFGGWFQTLDLRLSSFDNFFLRKSAFHCAQL
jgi:hypothetical protein